MTAVQGTQVQATIQSSDFSKPALLELRAIEEMSQLFTVDVWFSADDHQPKLEPLLGHTMAITCVCHDFKRERVFHGHIIELAHEGWTDTGRSIFHACLRPWFWFLSQTVNCRIFQEKSVADIITEVFKQHGFSDYRINLFDSPAKRPYCVQYRESDFNFLCRLMDEEGIYFYFEDKKGHHELVITDNAAGHHGLPSGTTIAFFPPTENLVRPEANLSAWSVKNQVLPGRVTLDDFDFKKPRTSLLTNHRIDRSHDFSDLEVFDYPGNYADFSSGERFSRLRSESNQTLFGVFHGAGNIIDATPGGTFKLRGHPLGTLDQEYVLIACEHRIITDTRNSRDSSTAIYQLHCDAVCNSAVYRNPKPYAKPIIHGLQTAMVVGPDGEEIYTDEYGRVKVQFHWDRYSKGKEDSSCWIRVAQVWAGARWGAIHTPRIGQEVIIGFLEGDPDCPIITGRVYNGDNMPPYPLPQAATQSGIKSRSSKGGGANHFNEIRFEDAKGQEMLLIHAEKDQSIEVENDESHWVGHDRQKTVDHDETSHIKHDRTESVDNNESITIGVDRTESVGRNESLTIGKNQSTSIAENQDVSIGKNQSFSIGENRNTTVGKDEGRDVGGNDSLQIGKDQEVAISGQASLSTGKDYTVSVGKKLVITAADEITLKTGSAQIVMKKNGDITISGGKINIKGSGDVILKGSKIAAN